LICMTKNRKKILVAGTFDIIHPGHIYLIQQAQKLGDVYVIVSRTENVIKIKGRPPIIPDEQRLEVIRNIKGVKHAVLGDKENMLVKVKEINPDIILLGPNQPFDESDLQNKLRKEGISAKIIRLQKVYNEYPYCSTSKIVARILEICAERFNKK